jgi:hypothetical protein
MYGRTNRLSKRLTRRQKHVMATVCGLVLLAFVGLGIWGALAHDSYGQSANGCVNFTVPSSTGGATFHFCGSAARAFCRAAQAGHDQISLRAQPQCRLAGFLPATSAPPSPPP